MLNFGPKSENEKKEIVQINPEIYSSAEGADPPRGFGFEEARRAHPRALPSIFEIQKPGF